MSFRFKNFECYTEDPAAVKALVENVLASSDVCVVRSEFPCDIIISPKSSDGGYIVSAQRGKFRAEVRSSPPEAHHRRLFVDFGFPGVVRKELANSMLNIIEGLEGVLKYEHVRGYDLMKLYFERGYRLDESNEDIVKIKNGFINYLRLCNSGSGGVKTEEKRALPVIKLRYDPEAAAIYWKELKKLSGYVESGN